MSGSSRVPPISSHPAFPKAVAVWFSALFGLSLLVLPHFAIEGMLGAVGLRSTLTFFAAPLSTAAHLTVCAFGAVFGALVGLAIARRLAGPAASEEQSFVEPEVEPTVAEPAVAAAVQTPVAETPVSEAQSEPAPAPVPETAEPELAEEAPAPSSARGSIADRLASRVRASENIEPSISDDVAALAANKEARNAEQTATAQEDTFIEAIEDETANSADILLASMPAVERGDEWKSEDYTFNQEVPEQWDNAAPAAEPEERPAYTSAEAEEEELDILSTADPLYNHDGAPSELAADDAEDFEVEEVESFLEESLIEDEPVVMTPTVETHETQGADYGVEGDPAEAPMEMVQEMAHEPEPMAEQATTPVFTPEFAPEFTAEPTDEPEPAPEAPAETAPDVIIDTKHAGEPAFESNPVMPQIAAVETPVESDVETAEAETPQADVFEGTTSDAPTPETGRKPDLGQMLARLESSIGSFETADGAPQAPVSEGDAGESRDDDPVVINLRQEAASKRASDIAPGAENDTEEDPEESLRKALDRLTQVSGTA